jgi:hypothetical protein
MELSNLKYDLSLVSEGQLVIERFPDLAGYKEFSDPENDLLLRIAFLAIDEGSPFLKKYRDDYENRINSIFEYLELDDKELKAAIILNSNENYSAIVNRFFVLCDNLAYVMWSNMLFNFHMIGVALRQPPNMANLTAEMDKRAKLQVQQSQLHEQLAEYEAKIFPDSTTRKTARKEIAKILQFPERLAQEKSPI